MWLHSNEHLCIRHTLVGKDTAYWQDGSYAPPDMPSSPQFQHLVSKLPAEARQANCSSHLEVSWQEASSSRAIKCMVIVFAQIWGVHSSDQVVAPTTSVHIDGGCI